MMDAFIEIPQYGIVRSLNVHISAVICIWECVKQKKGLTNNGGKGEEEGTIATLKQKKYQDFLKKKFQNSENLMEILK